MKKITNLFCFLLLVSLIVIIYALGVLTDNPEHVEVTVHVEPIPKSSEDLVLVSAEEEVEEELPTLFEREAPYKEIPLDDEYQVFLADICEKCGVDFFLAVALMESESTFKADAVGDGGKSIGFMQINRINWDRMQEDYDLDVADPYDNIEAGVRMLAELQSKYKDATRAVQCYKAGEGRGNELWDEGVVLSQATAVVENAMNLQSLRWEECNED